jgi:hypothetical protein
METLARAGHIATSQVGFRQTEVASILGENNGGSRYMADGWCVVRTVCWHQVWMKLGSQKRFIEMQNRTRENGGCTKISIKQAKLVGKLVVFIKEFSSL